MKYRIVYKNHDVDDYWRIVGYVEPLLREEDAVDRIVELYEEWPSQFKMLDILVMEEQGCSNTQS